MNANQIKISVIIPLLKERGAELECLRTWTYGQRLARDQYQVILITRHDNAELDREAEALLQPHDLWLSSSGSVSKLNDVGARAASAPLLFFTEVHCLGDPDCLEQLIDWAARHPHHAGACTRSRDRNTSEIAKMEGRILQEQFAEWSRPNHWHRVLVRGFAIRRHAYEATDGFQADYPNFADIVLAVQLHRGGWSIDISENAWVTHINTVTWAHLLEEGRTYGASEHRFRLRADAVDYERYVAANEEWCAALAESNAHPLHEAWTLLAAFAGLLDAPAKLGPNFRSIVQEAGSFGRLILGRLISAVVGPRWRLTKVSLRLALAHCRFRIGQRFGCDRLQAFKDIWDLTIRKEMVRQALDYKQTSAMSRLSAGTFEADKIPLGCWLGVYGLESAHGRAFRWTRPICRWQWQLAPGQEFELILDTGGLRSPPRNQLFAAFWNGQRVAETHIREEGDRLHLTVRGAKTIRENELMLVCMPFTPSRHGSPDTRILGLPIFAVVCHELAQRSPALPDEREGSFQSGTDLKAA